ncbi:MAG: LuxR C-terminal-related transcriptional regulator [Ignavibacteria bacterium]|nr:LuxR C-terminal-related transcriptional regulator [Ignavibacteria bacterium]
MKNSNQDYNLFLEFFDTFSKSGIERVSYDDPHVIDLERLMEINKQFFYISDIILMDILYFSRGIETMFGIEREKLSQGFFLTTTHLEDYKRHCLARTKLIHMGQELYEQKKGFKIISTNVRAQKTDGDYFNALYQAYLFYSKVPYESVFLILIITDISEFKNIHKGFHFYNGNDRNFFKFPDDELLMTGSIFSPTEFKIIELINEGLSSKEIADKLFRSVNTINTHRTNILEKSGKSTIAEVIRDLKNYGLL